MDMDATFWNDRYAVANHVYGEERDVIEGTGHTGRGSVVQVPARRPLAANNLFSSNDR